MLMGQRHISILIVEAGCKHESIKEKEVNLMEKEKKTNKKSIWIVIVCVVLVAIIAAVLIIFKDSLFRQKVSFDSDIVIKRTDGQDPLEMPYEYSEIFLTSRSFFKDEIAGLNMSSVNYEISETGIRWGGVGDLLVNMGDKDAIDILGAIKYCKGITDISAITSDKKKSSIRFYEGYSADLLMDSKADYVIIPSSMKRYINNELTEEEKILTLRHSSDSGYLGMYKIIGEYTTRDEYDTIYVSYSGFGKLIMASQDDMTEYVDTLEIDVYEEKDLSKLIEYLRRYFVDENASFEYEGKTNKFDEPYLYQFVHSLNLDPVITESPVETVTDPSPTLSTQPEVSNDKNVFTISRIDGDINLKMSPAYADALIRDYETYSQYITDIVISTGVMGTNRRANSPTNPITPYGIIVGWKASFNYFDHPGITDIMYHQAVTSINDIKKMKSDCGVTFLGDYTDQDLIVPREEDCKDLVKGYAIIPVTLYEAYQSVDNLEESDYLVGLHSNEEAVNRFPLVFTDFKVIGYYVTTDEYDTVYVTYAGYNEKYKIERFKNEYIESIMIETNKDMDITPFIKYLEKYFVPADNADKFDGTNNELGTEYEFCYTRTEGTD